MDGVNTGSAFCCLSVSTREMVSTSWAFVKITRINTRKTLKVWHILSIICLFLIIIIINNNNGPLAC